MSTKDISAWSSKYLNLAKHVSTWSKDPSTKIGAVAVGDRGQILSTGYNGFPRNITDSQDRLNNRESKYKYVVHGEMNCIYNATLNGVSLNEADLYVYGLPICSECAKGVIQVGVRRTFMCYPETIRDKWKESYKITSEMFDEVGIYHETIYEDTNNGNQSICSREDNKGFYTPPTFGMD